MENLLILGGSIAFLCALVWLMYKEGSKSSWHEISKEARDARDAEERR